MSKHNYSQYSNKKNKYNNNSNAKPEVVSPEEATESTTVKMAAESLRNPDVAMVSKPVIEPIIETVETVALPKTVKGMVANCAKLNIRMAPSLNADVVCVLDVFTEFEIDVTKSVDGWFKIRTASGAEGYCMRKFVKANL